MLTIYTVVAEVVLVHGFPSALPLHKCLNFQVLGHVLSSVEKVTSTND